MRHKKRAPLPLPDYIAEPFVNAEEAWFWYVRSQEARDDGARMERGMQRKARPCDPDDIYCAVKSLAQKQLIGADHVRVLCKFGGLFRPPDNRREEERRACQYWDEALERLTMVLRRKDIIE